MTAQSAYGRHSSAGSHVVSPALTVVGTLGRSSSAPEGRDDDDEDGAGRGRTRQSMYRSAKQYSNANVMYRIWL